MEKSEALQEEAQALKKRLKKRLIWLVVFIIIVVVSLRISSKTASKEDLKKYKYQCEHYVPIQAELASQFDQLKFRRIATEIDVNTFYYMYSVNGNEYKASKTSLSKQPDSLSITIWYDKANPSVNATNDPCEFYNKIKDRPASSFSNISTNIGLASVLFVIYFFFSSIKTICKLMFNKVEKKIVK